MYVSVMSVCSSIRLSFLSLCLPVLPLHLSVHRFVDLPVYPSLCSLLFLCVSVHASVCFCKRPFSRLSHPLPFQRLSASLLSMLPCRIFAVSALYRFLTLVIPFPVSSPHLQRTIVVPLPYPCRALVALPVNTIYRAGVTERSEASGAGLAL